MVPRCSTTQMYRYVKYVICFFLCISNPSPQKKQTTLAAGPNITDVLCVCVCVSVCVCVFLFLKVWRRIYLICMTVTTFVMYRSVKIMNNISAEVCRVCVSF